jgi:hypothetical protein
MVPLPLRETPERAVREKGDAPDGVPGDVPARAVPQVREERMNADLGLRLVVEDLDAPVLQHGRDVIGHLFERIAVLAVSHPVPEGEIVGDEQDAQ